MTKQLSAHGLGLASDFGIPGIDGTDVPVLAFDKFDTTQSVQIKPAAGGVIDQWVLAMDVYIPQETAGGFVSLLQTGSGDADLFLRKSSDAAANTAGIGISGVYEGEVPFDSWVRLAVSVTIEDGQTILRKFVNGELVGTQELASDSRWTITPETGLRLFSDNDGETAPGYVSAVFFMPEPPAIDYIAAALAAMPAPNPGGFLPESPWGSALEVTFENETVATRYGNAEIILEGSDYRTELVIGDSMLGRPSQLGIEGPNGADIPVLHVGGFTANEHLSVRLPIDSPTLTNYTAVWDIRIDDTTGGFQALLQTAPGNTDDADLFVNAAGGLGIGGQYHGTVPFGEWARIAISLSDNGNGTSQLSKYIDGVLVGEQTVQTSRYALQPNRDILLLTDNDGETGAAALAHFGIMPRAMTSDEIAALGDADGDGPFSASAPVVDENAPAPVRLTDALEYQGGAVFTQQAVATEGLTFASEFTFRIVTEGTVADGFTFQLQSERPGESLLGSQAGGYLGLPLGNPPLVAVVFDTYRNSDFGDAAANQIRIIAGGDATSTPLAVVNSPVALANGSANKAWVEYDGTTLSVYVSATDTKPASPVIELAIDLSAELGETARFGFSGATGGSTSVHDILEWSLQTNDASAPAGAMLTPGNAELELLGHSSRLEPSLFDPTAPMQLGFDGYAPQVEFGFAQIDLVDTATLKGGIPDYLVTPNDEPLTFDLYEIFGANAYDFAVTNSNGEAVDASITDGVLTLSFGGFGLADLVITATGAGGQELRDDARIRVAGEGAYTIAIMPDTQGYTSTGDPAIRKIFSDMTKWIADNAANKGIGFVTHVGDITDHANDTQFGIARDAYDILREAGIPFSLLPGNHDMGPGGSASNRESPSYNNAFSVGYMSEDPTFGGVYDQEPERYDNNYHLWTAPDGTGWIFLNLEFGPRDDVLRWADQVLTEHGDRKAMIQTHSYNNFNGRHDPLGGPLEAEGAGYDYGIGNDTQGAWDGEEIWREVIAKHPNVLFTAGGHIFGDGAETVVSYNDYGNPVFQFLVNYQNGVSTEANQGGRAGNGAIRLVTVDPENGAFYTETYFTEFDEYFTGYRGSEEKNRDGLTGSFTGHQEEYYGVDLGDRAAQAKADAGFDRVVETDGKTATVDLSAARSTDPADDIVAWTWTDKDGHVVATGKEASVELGAGIHDLTLRIETATGIVSHDEVRVIVKTDDVWLVDTFNDGNANGWATPSVNNPAAKLSFGSTADFGLPEIAGEQATVMRVNALAPSEALHITSDVSGPIQEYTLIYDLYLPSGQGNWAALLQTDISNKSDAELFLRNNGGGVAGMGISGNYPTAVTYDSWNRVAVTLTVENGQHVMRRFVNGEQVGNDLTVDGNVLDGSRWTIDGDRGFLLFSDEDNETSQYYVSSVAFVPTAFAPGAVAALGGADATGPLASGDLPSGAFQMNFDGSLNAGKLGEVQGEVLDLNAVSGTGPFFVKGSATIPDSTVEDPQGALFDRSNTADNMLIRQDGDWDDLIFEVTIRSMDKDTIGVAFNYNADGSHYLLTLNNANNTRQLVRVEENGERAVLASEAGGYTFNDAQDLVISKVDGRITATLDGVALFGGAVIDDTPLSGGTVGLYSSYQKSSIFDDVVVRAAETTAHAGHNVIAVDWDGNGVEAVALNGMASILVGVDADDAQWTGRGLNASGLDVDATAHAGRNVFTLSLGDDADQVTVDLASGDRLIAADRFEDGDHDGWRIIDTTELGGGADWQVIDGRLVETSGAYSRELTFTGSNHSDVWQRGWSPLGDGTFALHKGSYALWDEDTDLTDYAIQAVVEAPRGSVGLLLNYVDENNYYKIELDARSGIGLTSLVKVVDNYESLLARGYASYTPGEEFAIEARIVDGKISATVDGHDIFAYAVEDHDIASGATGVWSWGAAGAAFDDIAIIDLSTEFRSEIRGTNGNDRLVGTDGDDLIFAGAGATDLLTGGAGADVFIFEAAYSSNGAREVKRILDYDAETDLIDLDGAAISQVRETAAGVQIWFGADKDQLIVAGVSSFDELTFA